MGMAHVKISSLFLIVFVTSALSDNSWTQPQLQVQNSGYTEPQQSNNNQGYQEEFYAQEPQQQIVDELQQNAQYAYQGGQQPVQQVYDNSVYQQPQQTQYYEEPQVVDTRYAYNGQQAENSQLQHQYQQQQHQQIHQQQVPEYQDQSAYQSQPPPQHLVSQHVNEEGNQYHAVQSQPIDQAVSQTRIQSRSDTVPAQSRISTIISQIKEFFQAFFNSERTARNDQNDHPGLAAILSVSSLIVASILYI